MNRMILCSLLLSALSLVACGDDDGDDTTSGLESKQIKDLTDAEAKELCESVAAEGTISKEASCTVNGILSAAVGQDCEAAKQMCLSEPEDPSSTPDCSTATKPSTTCTATVGELTSCYSAIKAQFDALTCASDPSSLATMPESCQKIQQACPELFNNEE